MLNFANWHHDKHRVSSQGVAIPAHRPTESGAQVSEVLLPLRINKSKHVYAPK